MFPQMADNCNSCSKAVAAVGARERLTIIRWACDPCDWWFLDSSLASPMMHTRKANEFPLFHDSHKVYANNILCYSTFFGYEVFWETLYMNACSYLETPCLTRFLRVALSCAICFYDSGSISLFPWVYPILLSWSTTRPDSRAEFSKKEPIWKAIVRHTSDMPKSLMLWFH